MKNTSIKTRVDASLSSINEIKSAVPSPYFYMKVLAKINNAKTTIWETWAAFFLRPTIAFATICFIVVVNAFVLYSRLDIDDASAEQTGLAVTDEYNESLTALYDLENEKP